MNQTPRGPFGGFARQLLTLTQQSDLLRSSLGSLLLKVFNTFLTFALAVYLARRLGPAGYGVYAFAIASLMLMAVPMQTGLSHLTVRETAKAKSRNDWGTLAGLLRWCDRTAAGYFGAVLTLTLVALFLGSRGLESAKVNAIGVGVLLLLVMPLTGSRGSAIRGVGHGVLGQVFDASLRPGLFLALLIVLQLFASSWDVVLGPELAIGAHALAATLAFLAAHLTVRRMIETNAAARPTTESLEWRRSLQPLFLVAGLQLLNGSADVLLMGVLRTDAETGVYRVVTQVASLVVFGLTAINQILHSRFSELFHQNKLDDLQALVTRSVRVILFVALPPTILLFAGGEALLEFFFGDEYGIGAMPLRIVVVGQLGNVAFGSVAALLNMTGHERDTVRGMLVAGILNVVLNLTLIPSYGMNGAAIATAVSVIAWNFVLWRAVRARLGIESGFWGARRSQ